MDLSVLPYAHTPPTRQRQLDAAEQEKAVHAHIAQPLKQIDQRELPALRGKMRDGVTGAMTAEDHRAERQIEPRQLLFTLGNAHRTPHFENSL